VFMIVRPPGTLSYVSYFATWLLAVTFLSLSLAKTDRIACIPAALAAIAMVLTGTRAAVLGLVAGLLFYAVRAGLRISRRMVAAAAIIAVAGAIFYISPAGDRMRARVHWSSEDKWGGARLQLWRDTLRMSASRLPAGYGPESYTPDFPRFESRDLARAYPDFSYESPHNIFFDALIAQGIPGLLLLIALCALGLRGTDPWISAGVAATLVAQQFTTFTIPTALIFFTMIALAAGREPQARQAHARFTPILAPITLALLYVAFRFTAADRALELTQRAINASDIPVAAQHYTQHQRWRLPGGTADLWYSRAMLNAAMKAPNPADAIQAAGLSRVVGLAATRNAEDPFNAWYSLAQVYAAANDPRQTEACLRNAIAVMPNWFKPHWSLAQLLGMESRNDEARAEAALAADLDAGKNPEVVRTLEEMLRSSRN